MDIPTILISAIFRPGQIFFKPYGRLFRRLLNSFDRIFVQEEQSARLLRSLNCSNVEIAGDTRVDRVLDIAGKSGEFPLIDRFCAGASILVAGSTWPPDEALLSPFFETHLPENWKVIIAPHEIGERHLREVERLISLPCIRYSRATAVDPASFRILLIDNIGMLSALYRYGHIAYIGGGFGAGIHNILEPVAFELPVVFGPRHQKFSEAVRLIQGGGAFSVADTATFHLVFQKLLQPEVYQEASRQTKIFLKQNRGATRQILNYLSKKFPPGDETVTGR